MTVFAAGQRVTAGQLNDGPTPTQITTGATASTGFTLVSFSGYKIGGHLAAFYIVVNNTAGITVTSGNITDVNCAVLPAGYRPLDQITVIIGNGTVAGEAVVDPTTGAITLRAASDTIGAGTNIRIYGFFVSAL